MFSNKTSESESSAPQSEELSLSVLLELLSDLEPQLFGPSDTVVSQITEDSRVVREGSLFVARQGEHSDGRKYAAAALRSGAHAVLCEKGSGVLLEPRLEVTDIRLAWGLCAQALFADPSRSVQVVGITGTNGKTTVSSLVEQALNHLGQKVGRLGTLGFFVDGIKLTDSLTTPQPDQLAQNLAWARAAGAKCVLLEVSSHALSQRRVAGVEFAVVALTNLTQDHLDYHGTMKEYGEAKARLFREGEPRARVVNLDDALGRSLAAEFSTCMGTSAQGRTEAQIRAKSFAFSRQGMEALVSVYGEDIILSSRLLGRHNLENILTSWAILNALGIEGHAAGRALGLATGVPGRFERCEKSGDDIVVVVDYAHTPDALEHALDSLRELVFEELICVFGCGGDRDRGKRPLMGQIAGARADRVYLTSDNPRTENPLSILKQIQEGFVPSARAPLVQEDRGLAIHAAIENARAGAVVLIAGKGHEDYQLIGGQVLAFDDREVARSALARRRERNSK